MVCDEKNAICQKTLSLCLDVGEAMMQCGAEIYRVENTIERLCKAYGAADTEVFAIPSVIICSMRMQDGTESVQIRRSGVVSSNLFRLEALNALSRRLCAQRPPLDVFEGQLRDATAKRGYPFNFAVICAGIVSGAFALVFGGGLFEAAISLIIGIIGFILAKKCFLSINQISKTALLAFISGSLSLIFYLIFPSLNVGATVIGTVVLLVPGLAFGTALRNLLQGDLLSGILGIVRAILTAVMLALGYIFAFSIFGAVSLPVTRVGGVLFRSVTTLIGVAAFAIIFDIKPTHMLSVAVGGLLTFLIYFGLSEKGISLFASAFITSAIMCAYCEAMARIEKAPAIVFTVPCSIPILPGITLYNAMNALISGKNAIAGGYFWNGVQVGGGIACAIVLITVLFSISKDVKKSLLKNFRKIIDRG